jgi:uncharacterized membrane protein
MGAGTPATAAGRAPSAAARHSSRAVAPKLPGVTLYDQNDNDSGVGISSQNFESAFDAYDDQGADDFVVPAGHKWVIKTVSVTGVYYNGSGPAVSENVFIYKNSGGLPGALKYEADGVVGTDNGTGSFVINIPKLGNVGKAIAKGGATAAKTYWVSVQINMDFGVGGQWGWEGRLIQGGNNPAAWQNPGGGFGACSTWGVETTCVGDFGQGPDFMFKLLGSTT